MDETPWGQSFLVVRNTRDHLAWTIGNGDPTVYLTHGDGKGEARGRGRHKNRKIVRNLEERNVGEKRGKVANKT